jgi:hypothetical protein
LTKSGLRNRFLASENPQIIAFARKVNLCDDSSASVSSSRPWESRRDENRRAAPRLIKPLFQTDGAGDGTEPGKNLCVTVPLILLKMLQNFYFSFFPFRAHPPGCAYRYRLCYARRSQLSAKGGNRSTNLGGFIQQMCEFL